VSIEFSFGKVGTLGGSAIGGIIFLVLAVIGFYFASMLHARKVIDMFKFCKKPPPSAQELARMKYDEMMKSVRNDPMPGSSIDELKKDDEAPERKLDGTESPSKEKIENEELEVESLKDSFFASDPVVEQKIPKI
jgi:hypothetical protein